nr:hypothetical protein [Prevotella sp.]
MSYQYILISPQKELSIPEFIDPIYGLAVLRYSLDTTASPSDMTSIKATPYEAIG